MNNKIDIKFTCYKHEWADGVGTMFLFWPDGQWGEGKLTFVMY